QRETPGLVYIGANQQGSRDAIAHFLADIWPSVLAEVPGVQVHIVGPVGHHLPSHLIGEGVKICGLVPDLADFAGPDLIGLLPTRLMSGISIKVGEYLGLGLPIVAYPAGIDGYGDTLDDLVQTAETPAAFAATVIALLKDNDARQRLSKAGLKAAGTLLQNPEVVAALEDLASVDRS
ncbi:MAG: glycosyltransferase, partial [Pseudomonadota bacterium]